MTLQDEVKSLVQSYKDYGRYFSTNCIYHSDSNPSMMIYEDGYKCLACGASGSLQKLIKDLGGKVLSPSSKKLNFSNPFSLWKSVYGSIRGIVDCASDILVQYPDQSKYLVERGISSKFIRELRIGWLDGYYIFPIYDEWSELVGAVARVGPGSEGYAHSRYILPFGMSQDVLYSPNWGNVRKKSIVYVPFGIVDAISMHIAGFASITGITGKSLNPDVFSGIRKRIVFLPDRKEEKEATIIAGRLGWRGEVKRLPYQEEEKDPNDLLRIHGVNYLKSLLTE